MSQGTVIRFGKATVQIDGMNELFLKLSKIGENVQDVAREVFNEAVDRVYAESQARVPVSPEDGGQLKESGRKSKARVNRRTGDVRASVSYGAPKLSRLAPGDNPIYAIVQHEDLSLKHTTGQAKFLEGPMLAEKFWTMMELRDRIARKIGAS